MSAPPRVGARLGHHVKAKWQSHPLQFWTAGLMGAQRISSGGHLWENQRGVQRSEAYSSAIAYMKLRRTIGIRERVTEVIIVCTPIPAISPTPSICAWTIRMAAKVNKRFMLRAPFFSALSPSIPGTKFMLQVVVVLCFRTFLRYVAPLS
eukprot:593594-Prorocentrum_minimum.AAC.1